MKTLQSLFSLLLLIPLALNGQMAPDFTITTTHSETVELYADYLDQGQTVVIEIMFTTCPPCNSLAPDMEPFYQSWGGGDGDVEFFNLSNKSFDSNDDVADYEDQYGLTFPGAGEDGGSLDAVDPYVTGQFGSFYGTPTFVVIAPDGSVQFDVASGNNQQKLEDLDAAIASTGAEKPGGGGYEPDTVDYTVKIVKVDQATPLEGVTVELVDAANNYEILETGMTGSDGTYTFRNIIVDTNNTYASKAKLDAPPLQGVSTYDIVLMQRVLLGLDQVGTVFRERCMDTNGDGSLSALDILDVRKLILGIYDEFPGGDPWIFVGDNGMNQFVDTPVNFPDYGETNSSQLTLYGIKRGDLSGDVNPF